MREYQVIGCSVEAALWNKKMFWLINRLSNHPNDVDQRLTPLCRLSRTSTIPNPHTVDLIKFGGSYNTSMSVKIENVDH